MGLWSFLFGKRRSAEPEEHFAPSLAQEIARNERYQSRDLYLEGSGEYEYDIVGESRYQENLERIVGGKTDESQEFECTAYLTAEPSNPHDRHAVRVDINGLTVGYIPRDDAKTIGEQIGRRNAKVDAIITGGWRRRNGNEGSFGVKLDLL
jgi:hypothetical protein